MAAFQQRQIVDNVAEIIMEDHKIQQLRNRAYQIWEREGCPHARDLEHWLEAERELGDDDDRSHRAKKEEAGLQAARVYDRDVQEFGRHANVDAKAQEAKHALEGAEAAELKRAEAIGKSRGRG